MKSSFNLILLWLISLYFVFLLCVYIMYIFFFFFSSRRRHTRWNCDWSSDVCSSDLITGDGHVVVGLRGQRRQVHAPVAHVRGALIHHRPRGRVVVVAAVGEPDRVVDQLVVVARAPRGTAAHHADRVGFLHAQVGPVRGGQAGPAGADRPLVLELAVQVDLRLVRGRAGHRDQRPADLEGVGQVVRAVYAVGALDALPVSGEADRGVGRPAVPRPELHLLVSIPVPGADHRLGRGQLERPLDRGFVGDRPAERQHDRYAHAVGLLVPLEDVGAEGLRGRQGAERARLADLLAAGGGAGGGHRVALRHAQVPRAVPALGVGGQAAGHGVARGAHGHVGELARHRGHGDAVRGDGAVAAVRRGDPQVLGQLRGVRRRRRGGLRLALRGGDGGVAAAAAARGGEQGDDGRHREARVPSRVPC